MSALPQVGRCQHCQQVRPIFHYDRTHDNGDPIWDTPYPPYWPDAGAWLCAPHFNAAETARVNGRSFRVEHDLVVFTQHEPKIRTWANGGEVLNQADRDLATCHAIAAATEQTAP